MVTVPYNSKLREISLTIADMLRDSFPSISDYIGKYDYIPGEDDADPFTIVIAPGDTVPEEETGGDWGTGSGILTGTIDVFVTTRIKSETEGDNTLFWAEQILAWSHIRGVAGTLRPLRPGGIQRIELVDSSENPDISRVSYRTYFFTTYEVVLIDTAQFPDLDEGGNIGVPFTQLNIGVKVNPMDMDTDRTVIDL